MTSSSLVHATPASSLCAQLCVPQAGCRQSNSSCSLPEHRTLSRAISDALLCPKCALERRQERGGSGGVGEWGSGGVGEWGSEEERKNGKEGREKGSGREKEQRMRREGGPNVAVPCRK